MSDLSLLFKSQEKVSRWKAELNYASAQLNVELMKRNMRFLISQHEPLSLFDIDRDKLRVIFSYVSHGDKNRLRREMEGSHNAT